MCYFIVFPTLATAFIIIFHVSFPALSLPLHFSFPHLFPHFSFLCLLCCLSASPITIKMFLTHSLSRSNSMLLIPRIFTMPVSLRLMKWRTVDSRKSIFEKKTNSHLQNLLVHLSFTPFLLLSLSTSLSSPSYCFRGRLHAFLSS